MKNYSINGLAGVGKTTKMIEMAEQVANDGFSVVIITFNKKLQVEILQKINHPNIDVTTLHAIAYNKVRKQIDNYFNFSYVKKIYSSLTNKEATILFNIFNLWTYSSDTITEFTDKIFHSEEISNYINGVTSIKVDKTSLPTVIENIIQSLGGRTTHNLYLKEYQLSKPKTVYDVIFIDEFQDFSTVMIDIIESFNKPVYKFGDFNQKIYTWRNATGIFNIPFENIELNETKRCPQEFCDLANIYLQHVGGSKIVSNFSGGNIIEYDNDINYFDEDITFISNYNTILIENILKFGFKYNIKLINDIDLLKLEETWNMIYNFSKAPNWMQKFGNIGKLEKYYKETENSNMLTTINCAKLISDFDKFQNMVTFYDESLPTLTFTNIYTAKGLEWDNVVILSDFENFNDPKFEIVPKDFVRYVYVAITRAKKKLYIPSFLTKDFEITLLDDEHDIVKTKENEFKYKKSCKCNKRQSPDSIESSLTKLNLNIKNVTTISKNDTGLYFAKERDKENKRRGKRDKNGGGKHANENRYIESKMTGIPVRELELRDYHEHYLPTEESLTELASISFK